MRFVITSASPRAPGTRGPSRPGRARCSNRPCSVNTSDSDASRIAPAKARPKDEPERAAGRVHAGRLADALLLDRGERVVVELGDEEPEPGTGDQKWSDKRPAGVGVRDDRDQNADADADSTNPMRMILLGLRLPAFLPGEQRNAEHAERERRDREAGLQRVVSSTICRKSGSEIISPPSAICCSVWDEIPAGSTST